MSFKLLIYINDALNYLLDSMYVRIESVPERTQLH